MANYVVYEKYEKLFALFANKRRLAILDVLRRHKSASVGYIADKIHLSLHATSKHLQLLEGGGLVGHKEDGPFHNYFLKKPKDKIARYLLSQ